MTDCSLCACLSWFGGAVALYLVVKFLAWVKLSFFTSINMHKYKKKGGDWAVVTGASDGLGKAFSIELARQGFNIMLVSRTKSKLDDVAAECSSQTSNIKTKVFALDFSTAGPTEYRKLANEIDALEVGVLVNNVGINYDHPKFFEDVDVSEDLSVLKVNCESQLQLTKMVLPKMKARKSGAIVSMGSYSSICDAGLLSTYAATKAFNVAFSRAMATELSRSNIDVLAVTPGMVISNMSKIRRESFQVVAPKPFVRQALAKLGSVTQATGHWQHSIIEWITVMLPQGIRTNQVYGAMVGTKKRAEKKAAKK